MAKAEDKYPWWVNLTIEAVKSFGVTTVIVLALLWVTVQVVIPEMVKVANRYCDANEQAQVRIIKSQEDLVGTQKQLVDVIGKVSSAAEEIITVEQESQQFMRVVQEQHAEHLEKLNKIEAAVAK